MSTYITVAIPYVNSTPHVGYAFELIEADLVARSRRRLGEPVRFLGGTDEYSLKNVIAAERVERPVREFVDEHADRFADLAAHLGISFDDFIRTSRDPRHQPAVERLWRACAAAGDLYHRDYEGRYCVGCEQFYDGEELDDDCCPEHRTPLESVAETNWFFRLSRFGPTLIERIETGELLVEPDGFRAEVLAFLRSGLREISISRSVERARGWGVPVPDDPTQVVYVWFDALTNYISALGYGSNDEAPYERWWCGSDERIHVVGKGIVRFHAVYWPAFLLSAGLPLPTRIHVHPYLTLDGRKLSKSGAATVDPVAVSNVRGADRLRWWCARSVSATADTNFGVDRLAAVADADLANGLGNAVSRVSALVVRHRGGRIADTGAAPLPGLDDLPGEVSAALARFDRRQATDLIVDAVRSVNRYIESTEPWRLARPDESTDAFDRVADVCARSLRLIADAIEPITPELAHRIQQRLDPNDPITEGAPLVPRIR